MKGPLKMFHGRKDDAMMKTCGFFRKRFHSQHCTVHTTHKLTWTNLISSLKVLHTKMTTSLFWLSLSEFEGTFKISIKNLNLVVAVGVSKQSHTTLQQQQHALSSHNYIFGPSRLLYQ
ncbi:hypothetical protein V8G54_018626 [Vigna mungo]|uniref:Uncharacterized protein n=1 Tax=Vigna mungo TaxID=3915 RepID=A0AAQ3N8F9_VIGMU